MNTYFLSTLLLLPSVVDANSGMPICPAALTENKGVVCKDGSQPVKGCCNIDTCRNNGNLMDCCPANCRAMSMSGDTCTCTDCQDTLTLKPAVKALSDADRWTKAHNYVRCLHGQPKLTWKEETFKFADNWAKQCTYAHSSNKGFPNGGNGENLATQIPAYEFPPESATYAWYSEVNTANKGKGYKAGTASNDPIYGASGGDDQVGHYTALIWKSTSSLGCSRCPADSKGWAIDVCQYADSTPNIIGQNNKFFIENVPQSNTLVKTKQQCCEEIYGNIVDVPDTGSPASHVAAPAVSLLAVFTAAYLFF